MSMPRPMLMSMPMPAYTPIFMSMSEWMPTPLQVSRFLSESVLKFPPDFLPECLPEYLSDYLPHYMPELLPGFLLEFLPEYMPVPVPKSMPMPTPLSRPKYAMVFCFLCHACAHGSTSHAFESGSVMYLLLAMSAACSLVFSACPSLQFLVLQYMLLGSLCCAGTCLINPG